MEATRRRQFLLGGTAFAAIGASVSAATLLGPAQDGSFEVTHSDAEWRRRLATPQYVVLRKHQTEWAGSSPLDAEKRTGTYFCAGCDLPLFASLSKYDSRTGWPSFWQPLEGAVATRTEWAFFILPQTEVHCRRCGGHLGHVFDDGPKPTGLRYCMNGVAMNFKLEVSPS